MPNTKLKVLFHIPEINMKIFSTRCFFIALCATGLTACSSKPDSSDIQKELAEAYKCRVLELSEVKKAAANIGYQRNTG